MLRITLLFVLVSMAFSADMPMMSTPFPPMAPLVNPPLMKPQQFVSGSTPFVPNLMSNFSSSSNFPTVPGSGAPYFPPGYGIQQVFYPPPVYYHGAGGAYGSYPNFPSNPSSPAVLNQNPAYLGLQGHAGPVHQMPWYPSAASTCQGCNLIYRGLPYPGVVSNVQVPLQSNVPYVRNVPLDSLSPLDNVWPPHNIVPLSEPVVQNQPNLYSEQPNPAPVIPVVSESAPIVPESSIPVVPESSVPVSPKEVHEAPVSPVEVQDPKVPEVSHSRQKRAPYWPYARYSSWPYYGSYGYRSYYGGWPSYGYRSYYGGWPNYGYRSYYPYRSGWW